MALSITKNQLQQQQQQQQHYDIIVVGAGIMGSCAAHAASSLGRTVLLLEQFDLLHHLGSSHGESRTIRATYPEAHYPPMVGLARKLWDEAESEARYKVLTPTPHLDMGPKDAKSLIAVVANGGEGAKVVSGEELKERWGGVFKVPEGWTAVVGEMGGGVIKPTKAVAMFQALAMKKGAVLRDKMEVVDISRNEDGSGEGVLVKTASGEVFYGAKCIVTVGCWTRKLVKSVSGIDLPIQPLHCVICYWKIKEGHEAALTSEAGFPTFASYGNPYFYGTPSMEFPNLIKVALHGGPPCNPDDRDWATGTHAAGGGGGGGGSLVEPVAQWIQMVMPEHIDTAAGPIVCQSCMYAMTPDEDYVIDFLGGEFGKDVVIGGGFSGHGFKMGPAIGRILAELAIDGDSKSAAEATLELHHFRIGRFEGNPKGNVKDFEHQAATLLM